MKEPRQLRLVFKYCLQNGSILPAKMYGEVWEGEMFGSESSKRCRELRKRGIFLSRREGKFERFWIHPDLLILPQIYLNMDYTRYTPQESPTPSVAGMGRLFG